MACIICKSGFESYECPKCAFDYCEKHWYKADWQCKSCSYKEVHPSYEEVKEDRMWADIEAKNEGIIK